MASLKKRGKVYYAQFYHGGRQKRVCLNTGTYQIAMAKLRQIESRLDQDDSSPLPTKTATAQVVAAYLKHIRAHKAPGSYQKDASILKHAFGPIAPELEQISRSKKPRRWVRKEKGSEAAQKRRSADPVIENAWFERISPAEVSGFLATLVRNRGLAPRTANRYREVLCRLFNWAMQEGGIRLPNDKNPVLQVSRYKEKAPEIRFLTLAQIDEQLGALADWPQLQTMVAMYIYAGLRREEALWLRREDVDLSAGPYGMIRIQAKTVKGEFWQPKTAVNRAVPISSSLRRYLDGYAPRPSLGDWFFPSPEGRRYDPDNFSADLRHANRQARLAWTCLDYRHTFGSQLAMKGESLYKISTLMGNSPEICRKHYASLLPEALHSSVEFALQPETVLWHDPTRPTRVS